MKDLRLWICWQELHCLRWLRRTGPGLHWRGWVNLEWIAPEGGESSGWWAFKNWISTMILLGLLFFWWFIGGLYHGKSLSNHHFGRRFFGTVSIGIEDANPRRVQWFANHLSVSCWGSPFVYEKKGADRDLLGEKGGVLCKIHVGRNCWLLKCFERSLGFVWEDSQFPVSVSVDDQKGQVILTVQGW